MTRSASFKWLAAIVVTPIMLAVVFVAIFGWNWLRAPIERLALEKTGRVLVIDGDLRVQLGWPLPRLRIGAFRFANPPWAREPQMVAADGAELTVDLLQLVRQRIAFPEVRLERAAVFLEHGTDGRKSWLLDRGQQDEGARIRVDRLTLDHATVGYDDAGQGTSIRATLSSLDAPTAGAAPPGVAFNAQGQYKGLALQARGGGGPVLALRDEAIPYPLNIDARIGPTGVRADGTITNLLDLSAVDMRLAVRGENLEQLFPLLGIAVPATRAYTTDGRLLHSANSWRYEKFSGRFGASDLAGTVQVETGGKRPVLTADLVSRLLDIADLGPLIGARPGSVQAAARAAPPPAPAAGATPEQARVLPDLPFRTERWDSVDAQVTLRASTIRRARELPLENLVAHLSLRDSVLTLDPLDFGLAGGDLRAAITLDGRQDPIEARARVRARNILVARLLPTVKLNQNSVGRINGEFNLTGQGNSVRRMLATSDGKLGLVVAGGEISKLMMERAGLHLWEMLELNLRGDRLVKLRCAVADFSVKRGTMHADALIFDTEVTTLIGTGEIDLGQERLDLKLTQKTKITSPLALRSPIYVRGSFARPDVGVEMGLVAARGLGALALGVVNPLLALLPLIDAGPGQDHDCGQLVREAKAAPQPAKTKAGT